MSYLQQRELRGHQIDAGAVAAAVDLPGLIERYGIRVTRRGREYEALCPFHGERTPSFTVFHKGDRWFFKCFGCEAKGDAISFVAQIENIDFQTALRRLAADEHLADPVAVARAAETRAAREAEASGRDEAYRQERTAKARAIWKESRPAAGTVVEQYLRQARGLALEAQGGIPVTLRFHPSLAYYDSKTRIETLLPAMVAAVQNTAGAVIGIHQTFLKPDGSDKAEIEKKKMMMGPCWGAAVRFDAAAETIGAGEGIETVLSVRQALRMAGAPLPCWSALSLGNLGAMILPSNVKTLIWFADADGKDPKKTERLLAKSAAEQRRRGVAVKIARPAPGMDFNDMICAAELPPDEEK